MNDLLIALFWVFTTVSIINTLHIGFYLISANIYDIRQFKRRTQKSAAMANYPW